MSVHPTTRLAVDIGGTFTDVVLSGPAGQFSTKLLTTHDSPAQAVLAAIDQLLAQSRILAADVDAIIHGTTLAANTIIERRGARTALLVTAGHRDALDTAYENRFDQYDLAITKPAALVPRRLRWPVKERMSAAGRVLLELDDSNLADIIEQIREHNIESLAIGFLHAYINPRHEQEIAASLRKALPELWLSLSSEVSPQIREFDRLSTTVANAYVQPLMASYIADLERRLQAAGFNCPLRLVMSSGGLTTPATAAKFPVRLVESGPAGGAILAASIARQAQLDEVISFDMGGTTAKLCLINKGQPQRANAFEIDRLYRFTRGSGLPLSIPTIEMVEIGAGGGSIASVDELQRLRVGPRSAGSEPGPACYARGGIQATVTDADLLLGRIDAAAFAGGQLALSPAAANAAIDEHIAGPLGVETLAAAAGIAEVVDEAMANAARVHAVESGQDIAERTLIAFGGAAPLHAARLADKLGIRRIIIPYQAGVGSAAGFLLAPVSFELSRSRVIKLSELKAGEMPELVAAMREEATQLVRQSISDDKLTITIKATMRYSGQGHEVEAPLEADALHDTAAFKQIFESQYRKLYGRLIAGVDIEIVTVVVTIGEAQSEQGPDTGTPATQTAAATQSRNIIINHGRDTIEVPCYMRSELVPGQCFHGPALICEQQTTTLVPANMQVSIDAHQHIIMESTATS